jgi:hypothetical protein
MLSVIIVSDITLSVDMLCAIMPNLNMLSVISLSNIMLNVNYFLCC